MSHGANAERDSARKDRCFSEHFCRSPSLDPKEHMNIITSYDLPVPWLNGDGRSRFDIGIELGTSNVRVAVGERKPDGTLRIRSMGQVPSLGVRKGAIMDFRMVQYTLRQALAAAEMKSDMVIASVRLALTGAHISSFNYRTGIDLADDPGEVEESDCQLLWENARQAIPENDALLQSIVHRYLVDGQTVRQHPLGMSGQRLEADFHLVHGDSEAIHTSIRCVKELGLEIEAVVFAPIAASHALLNPTQKQEGALVIDIGGGTTDYAVYVDGLIRQSGVLAVGGNHITRDIAKGWRLPRATAERLKIEEGSALIGNHFHAAKIIVENGDRRAKQEIDRERLNQVILWRTCKTLEVLKQTLAKETKLSSLGAGLFLTGGTSLLQGIGPLAEEIFDLPVHLTHEQTDASLDEAYKDPCCSTALGLLRNDQP